MKLFKKYWLSAMAFVMTLVIGSYYTLGGFFSVEKELAIRTINLAETSSLNYKEVVCQDLEKFEKYEISSSENEDTLNFVGTRIFNSTELSELDFVSDISCEEDILVNYDLQCDKKNNGSGGEYFL